MEVAHFSEIEAEFLQRVQTMVWCSAATIDSKLRPRSRVLHPIWEGSTGWITTDPHSYKVRHLAQNPYISLAYVTSIHRPVYVDGRVEWVDDLDEKKRVWDLFKYTPPPLGFDPARDHISPDHEKFGLLKVTPWRIDLVSFPAESFEKGTLVWHNRDGGS